MTILQSFGTHSVKAFGLSNRQKTPPSFIRLVDCTYYITSIYQIPHSMLATSSNVFRLAYDARQGSLRFTKSGPDGDPDTSEFAIKPNNTNSQPRLFEICGSNLFYMANYYFGVISQSTFSQATTVAKLDYSMPYFVDYTASALIDNGNPLIVGDGAIWRYNISTNQVNYRTLTGPGSGSFYSRNTLSHVKHSDGFLYTAGQYVYSGGAEYAIFLKIDLTNFSIVSANMFRQVSGYSGGYYFAFANDASHIYLAGNPQTGRFTITKINPSAFGAVWNRTYDFGGYYGPRAIFFIDGVLYGICYTGSSINITAINPVDGNVLWTRSISNMTGTDYYGVPKFDGTRFYFTNGNSVQVKTPYFGINLKNFPPDGTYTMSNGQGYTISTATITSLPRVFENTGTVVFTSGTYSTYTPSAGTADTASLDPRELYYREIP